MPFFLTSMTGFLKEHFPVLVVGFTSGPQITAGFRVAQQIFRMAHTLVPNAFELLRSGLVLRQDKQKKPTGASPRYQNYAELYLLGSAGFAMVMVIVLPHLLWVWAIEPSTALYWVVVILGIDLLFSSATHVEFQIYLLKKNISYLAFMSITRQILTSMVIVVAGHYWGQVGVAFGTAVGAFYAWIGFLAYSAQNDLRPHRFLWRTSLIVVFMTITIIITSFFRAV
jgi:O-antigen/teichoic acid export membrane protein